MNSEFSRSLKPMIAEAVGLSTSCSQCAAGTPRQRRERRQVDQATTVENGAITDSREVDQQATDIPPCVCPS
jgi:hypothetical protein